MIKKILSLALFFAMSIYSDYLTDVFISYISIGSHFLWVLLMYFGLPYYFPKQGTFSLKNFILDSNFLYLAAISITSAVGTLVLLEHYHLKIIKANAFTISFYGMMAIVLLFAVEFCRYETGHGKYV